MNWDDLKDSSEYAEVIGLLASLIAAVMALKKAEKEDGSVEKATEKESDQSPLPDFKLKISEIPIDDKSLAPQSSSLNPNSNLIVAGLVLVAVIQLAIILFIAYRLA